MHRNAEPSPRPNAAQALPRTVVLSDLHLGRPGGALGANAFEQIVSEADRVIVNGDIAELHHARFQADAERELDLFRDLCASRGVKLDLVAGNHDPFVSEQRALSVADGAVYITHGDAFHPAVAPWSPFSASMRATFADALARTAPGTPEDEALFAAAREASIAEWRVMGAGAHVSTLANMAVRPHRVLTVLGYWMRYPALAANWAARFAPRAGTVIVGHSHRAFVRKLGGRVVVNTGSYGFPGVPHAVVLEGATASLHRIALEGARYGLLAAPLRRWTLAPRETAQPASAGAASTPLMNRAASPSATRSMDAS
jgi:predicted phosphodiesterase